MPLPASRRLVPLLTRSLAFGLAWWAITEGAPGTFGFGAAASVLAAAASLALLPPPWPGVRLWPLLRFLPYFAQQSFAGGLDVVRRAASPGVPVRPAILEYPVGHMGGLERAAFALTVNLVPGTLSIRLQDECLRLHAIDASQPVRESLAQLDARLGEIFGRGTRGQS